MKYPGDMVRGFEKPIHAIAEIQQTCQHPECVEYRRKRTEQMTTTQKPRIPSMVVLSCDHAGLQPHFQRLEDEIRRTIATIDDPKVVVAYLHCLWTASQEWIELVNRMSAEK
jgi:hypothetical protein